MRGPPTAQSVAALAAFVASLLAVARRGATVLPGLSAIIGRRRAIVSGGSPFDLGRLRLIRVDGVADYCVNVSLSGGFVSRFSCAIPGVSRAIGLVVLVLGCHPTKEY